MARYVNCKCGSRHLEGVKCSRGQRYVRVKDMDETQLKIHRFRNTSKWINKRNSVVKLDKGLCQRCFHKFGNFTFDTLEVHHIVPLVKAWELRLELDNLVTLCKTCHRQIEQKGGDLDFEWKREYDEPSI